MQMPVQIFEPFVKEKTPITYLSTLGELEAKCREVSEAVLAKNVTLNKPKREQYIVNVKHKETGEDRCFNLDLSLAGGYTQAENFVTSNIWYGVFEEPAKVKKV